MNDDENLKGAIQIGTIPALGLIVLELVMPGGKDGLGTKLTAVEAVNLARQILDQVEVVLELRRAIEESGGILIAGAGGTA